MATILKSKKKKFFLNSERNVFILGLYWAKYNGFWRFCLTTSYTVKIHWLLLYTVKIFGWVPAYWNIRR